jgi:PPE-repeat protein
LVVGVLAVATALASSAAARGARRLLPYVNRISGALLVAVGLYVGYYGIYELRVYLGDGPASDPVVDTAGQVQGILAGWVDGIGPLPLLLVLAVLLGGTVLLSGLGCSPTRAVDAPTLRLLFGPTNSGPTNSGPTNSGPTNSGPTNSGPTNSGPTNSGPTNSGPTNSGPTHSGPTHSGR